MRGQKRYFNLPNLGVEVECSPHGGSKVVFRANTHTITVIPEHGGQLSFEIVDIDGEPYELPFNSTTDLLVAQLDDLMLD